MMEALLPAEESSSQKDSVPFLDQLLENPLEFSPTAASTAISDAPPPPPPTNTMGDDNNNMKHSFCNPMMMMSDHEMAQHGVASMSMMGGDMSKGMVMYMDGFRFAMAGNEPCLNLYFSRWTLDTRVKFVGALLFVFALSFGTEGVSKYRHILSSSFRRQLPQQSQRRTRKIMIAALHGVQALLGYVVMLATMTFAIEILISVVLGLSCGYYYFFAGEIGLEGHVTTNPCCGYMQEESDDHEQQQQQQQRQHPQEEDTMTTGLLISHSSDGERHSAGGTFTDSTNV